MREVTMETHKLFNPFPDPQKKAQDAIDAREVRETAIELRKKTKRAEEKTAKESDHA
jgi:hypothetical protein